MRKLQTVTLAVIATFAFSVGVAASASAETTLVAKWLTGAGNDIAAGVSLGMEMATETLLEDTGPKAAQLCSLIYVGNVSAEGKDEITGVLNLKKETIGPLTGLSLSSAKGDCVNDGGCGTPIEEWPMNLPWKSSLFLMENGEILDLVEGESWTILCTVIFDIEDTCEFPDGESAVLNDAVTGDAEIPAGNEELPLGKCSIGGAGTAKDLFDELTFILLTNGELLSVSSE